MNFPTSYTKHAKTTPRKINLFANVAKPLDAADQLFAKIHFVLVNHLSLGL
jgi:hypothetical protein